MEIKRTWKDKHNILLRNKNDIIEKYNDDVSITEIAEMYGVTIGCISNNLKLWGIRKRSGIKYLLSKMLLEGDYASKV